MVYSNALYFSSHFDKLTDEVLSTFNVKQKSEKKFKLNKIILNGMMYVGIPAVVIVGVRKKF